MATEGSGNALQTSSLALDTIEVEWQGLKYWESHGEDETWLSFCEEQEREWSEITEHLMADDEESHGISFDLAVHNSDTEDDCDSEAPKVPSAIFTRNTIEDSSNRYSGFTNLDLSFSHNSRSSASPETSVSKKLSQSTLTKFLGLKPTPKPSKNKVQTSLKTFFTPSTQYNNQGIAGDAAVAGDAWQKRKRLGGGGSVEEINGKSSIRKRRGMFPRQPDSIRACPFYKRMPGTSFTVDAFKFGSIPDCSAYFLTHFHSDHYGGLTRHWTHGPIYCTPVTARLVHLCLGVSYKWMRPIRMGVSTLVDGVEVTFLPANHCPGSALILFHILHSGYTILHTGDFRASTAMQQYPHLKQCGTVHSLYLDTTYCNPKYWSVHFLMRHLLMLTRLVNL